jgi:hypothetical protein
MQDGQELFGRQKIDIQTKRKLINNFAPDFFGIIGESLLRDLVISVFALIDNDSAVLSIKDLYKTKKNSYNHIEWDILEQKYGVILEKSARLKECRDRFIAHINKKSFFENDRVFAEEILSEVDTLFPLLDDFINTVTTQFEISIHFDTQLNGDGDTIIGYLSDLNKAREAERMKFD